MRTPCAEVRRPSRSQQHENALLRQCLSHFSTGSLNPGCQKSSVIMLGSWDTAVALSYAAEELVFAAQALTSDLLSREQGVAVAHRHLHGLMRHERSLPTQIGDRLRRLDALYTESENSGLTVPAQRQKATVATMSVLGDIRDLLAVAEHKVA
jgi:hypothetical protein